MTNNLLLEHFPLERQEEYFDRENDVKSIQLTSINADLYSSDCDKRDVYDIPFEKIANGCWCDSAYPGKAMDIHYRSRYIAYATDQLEYGVTQSKITVKQLDSQRSVPIAQRDMRGKIQDIAFSYTVDPAFLACVFNSGFIWIFRLVEKSRSGKNRALEELPDFDVKLVYSIKSEMNMGQINFQRVCWCPCPWPCPARSDCDSSYSDRRSADKCGRLFSLFCGSRIDTYNLDSIRRQFGPFKGEITHDQIADGVTTIALVHPTDNDFDLITDMKFSSNGEQIAYVANDGHVRIHTVQHSAQQIGSFELYPPGSILSLTFLDANADLPSAWNIALTFAHNTNEAKIWKCREWNCLQLIRLDPDCVGSSAFFGQFKIFADPDNRFVFLSDNRNNAAYALHAQQFDDHDVTMVNRVTEFILPCRVITMSVLETKCTTFDRATPYNMEHVLDQDGSSSSHSAFSGVLFDAFVVEKLAIGRVPLMIALKPDRSLFAADTETDFTNVRFRFPHVQIKRNLNPVFTLKRAEDGSVSEKDADGRGSDCDDSDTNFYGDRTKGLRERTNDIDQRYLVTWQAVTSLRSDSVDLYLKAKKISESVPILVRSALAPTLNSYLSNAGNVLRDYVATFPVNYVETFERALDCDDKDVIRVACAQVDFVRLFENQYAPCDDVLLKAVDKLRADLPNTFRGGSRAFLENAFLYFKINKTRDGSPIFWKMRDQLADLAETVADKRIQKCCRELIELLPIASSPIANTETLSIENVNSAIAVSLKNNNLKDALNSFGGKKKDIFASLALAPKVVFKLASKLADALPGNVSVACSYLPAVVRYWKRDEACKLKYPSLLDDLVRKLNYFYSSDDRILSDAVEPLLAILDNWPKIKVDQDEDEEQEPSERWTAASSNNASADCSRVAHAPPYEISGTSDDSRL